MTRGYLGRALQFERTENFEEADMDSFVTTLGERHAQATLDGEIDMVEIEFLDEPDVMTRFLRIGTNPEGMVIPLGFFPRF